MVYLRKKREKMVAPGYHQKPENALKRADGEFLVDKEEYQSMGKAHER
jgi:hypothetical protein